MLLNIPVLDLLHSQFDIELNVGVDPFSGKATYNVKDIHSRPRQPHSLSLSLAGDLTLALLNSPEESPSDPGTLCIRISPAQVSMSEQGLANMPEGSSSDFLSCWKLITSSFAQSLYFTLPIPRAYQTNLSVVRI